MCIQVYVNNMVRFFEKYFQKLIYFLLRTLQVATIAVNNNETYNKNFISVSFFALIPRQW